MVNKERDKIDEEVWLSHLDEILKRDRKFFEELGRL
jgi:hypothetical protein